jgi:isocitrate dehydrogenase
MKTKKLKPETEKALNFLSARNPLTEYWSQVTYVTRLMTYINNKGENALQALAGFYVWCLDNLEGEKISDAIASTFAHDLGQQEEKLMLPRSSSYLKFWKQELKNRSGRGKK